MDPLGSLEFSKPRDPAPRPRRGFRIYRQGTEPAQLRPEGPGEPLPNCVRKNGVAKSTPSTTLSQFMSVPWGLLAGLLPCVPVPKSVRKYGAAALGYPAIDSIKREADGFCQQGIDRSHVWCVQTPQGASVENFRIAYSRRPEGEEHTDELGLLEAAGISAKLVEGSRENIKVTLPGDEDLAAFFLSQRQRRGRDG